ncbi:MAG: hypothetical protein HUJ75_05735, partial [Parasporobacterium sp.]|nr:hypothetical protein [Parasporobacterium sp.]
VIPRAEMQVLGVEWSYELVLDDLTSSGTQFKNLWSDLTPGENITIKLSVGSSNPKVRTGSAEGVTNSLFGDGTTADTAEVMFGRHLQNLDLTTSGTTTAITTAVQKQNISFADDLNNEDDWATVYKNKTFKPINNSNLVSYTGSFTPDTGTDKLYTTINGLTITNADNAGLFGKVDSGKVLALTDVKLTGASVNGTTNAGTFIGQVSGNASLTGCQVYLTYTDTDKVYIQAPNAGGLIGAAASGSNITITESFAATEVGAAGNTYAGGLVGSCAGTLNIDKSYADCYLSGQNVGGLVGRSAAGSAITISTSYAAGFAEGSASAAGMVNGPVSTINNAYTALGYTFPDNTTGYVFYPVAASGTASNTYYLDISGITKQGNISTITAKTSSDLANTAFAITGFSKADNNTTSHPYNFRELALSNYPYLKLSGIPHYGDWLEPFAEGRLCYFEKYQDNSFGFYGSGINALKAGEYVKGDGYGFVFESDNPNSLPHITITYYTADGSTASLTIKGDKKTEEYPAISGGAYNVNPIPIVKDNKTYYLMPLPEIVYNTGYASPDFYQPLKINKSTGNTGTETYYYNPHFAKTQRQTDVCPSVVEGTVTEIRSAKHLYNLSKYNDVYAASSEKGIFLQMNPIDYELYDWTYYGKRGDVTSPVSVQTPIGGSSSAGPA